MFVLGQVDEAWAITSVSSSASLPDEEDEYPLAQRRVREDCRVAHEPAAVGVAPETATKPRVRGSLRTQLSLTSPFTSTPLYIFMSLQI